MTTAAMATGTTTSGVYFAGAGAGRGNGYYNGYNCNTNYDVDDDYSKNKRIVDMFPLPPSRLSPRSPLYLHSSSSSSASSSPSSLSYETRQPQTSSNHPRHSLNTAKPNLSQQPQTSHYQHPQYPQTPPLTPPQRVSFTSPPSAFQSRFGSARPPGTPPRTPPPKLPRLIIPNDTITVVPNAVPFAIQPPQRSQCELQRRVASRKKTRPQSLCALTSGERPRRDRQRQSMPALGYAKHPAFREEEEEAEDELVQKEKEKRKSMPIVMATAQAEVNKGEIERIELVARKPRLMVIDEPYQGTEALVVAAHAGKDAAEKAENPSEELRESSYSYIPPLKSLTSIIEDVECVLGNMNDSFVSERPRRTDTGESMYSEMDMEASNQRTNAEGKTSVKEDTNLPGSSSLFYDIRKALALDEDEEDDIYECYAKDESQNVDDDQWTDDPAVVWPNLTSEEIAGGYRELIGTLEIAPV